MPSWAQFSYSVAPSGALLVLSVTADQPVCGAGLVAAAMVDVQRLTASHEAAQAAAVSRHEPQQPLHAQVGKYSVRPIFIIIHLNLSRLGSDWHLEASLKSVCGVNICNLLQHQDAEIVDFMGNFYRGLYDNFYVH